MEERNAFVFYKTFKQTADCLQDEKQKLRFYEALVSYGLTGDYDRSDPLINACMTQACFTIDRAQENYDKSIAGGKKGGARRKYDPDEIRTMAAEGKTREEIANILGCSTKTIQRALNTQSESEFRF